MLRHPSIHRIVRQKNNTLIRIDMYLILFLVHVDMCAEVQQRLQQFSREVLDLLKNQGSHCRLPVSKFVSAYHQYFSRQCRVADYGFSKIIDLLSAIPKSIQILGDGNKRIMTITHRCQMKRFTNDIIRILKNKPQRSMSISEIPIEYGKLFDFQIRNK